VEGFSPGLRLYWLIAEMFGTEITHLAPRKKVGGETPLKSSYCGGANWSLAPYGPENCPLEHLLEISRTHR